MSTKGQHGGARKGAGRKAKPTPQVDAADARAFLTLVMSGLVVPSPAQLDAAKALLRANSAGGKKEEAKDRAEKVASRFAPRPGPPALKVVGA